MITLTIPFPGFYESILSSELDRAEEQLAESLVAHGEAFGLEPSDVIEALMYTRDYSVACRAIAKEYAEAFADFVTQETQARTDAPFAFTYDTMDSPREYNFTTDRCYMTLPLADFERLYAATDPEILKRQIHRSFTSCDGFMSYYSGNVADWDKPLSDYDHNEAGAVLVAYLETHNLDTNNVNRLDYQILERISCNGEFDSALDAAIDWNKFRERMKDMAADKLNKGNINHE